MVIFYQLLRLYSGNYIFTIGRCD